MPETHQVRVQASANGLGSLSISLETPTACLLEFRPSDEDTLEIVKRGLERLSGQGKVDEELRSMCHCVGQIEP